MTSTATDANLVQQFPATQTIFNLPHDANFREIDADARIIGLYLEPYDSSYDDKTITMRTLVPEVCDTELLAQFLDHIDAAAVDMSIARTLIAPTALLARDGEDDKRICQVFYAKRVTIPVRHKNLPSINRRLRFLGLQPRINGGTCSMIFVDVFVPKDILGKALSILNKLRNDPLGLDKKNYIFVAPFANDMQNT